MGAERAFKVHILPDERDIPAACGETLLCALRRAGEAIDAPCGGNGSCGKCGVILVENGAKKPALACRTVINGDLTVQLTENAGGMQILTRTQGGEKGGITKGSPALAFDVGTTTIAGYLVNADTGEEIASSAGMNPQYPFGADVIARLSYALEHGESALTNAVREAVGTLAKKLCAEGGVLPEDVHTASVVGNTAMQHLYLGLPIETLSRAPFTPYSLDSFTVGARDYGIPIAEDAKLIVPPVIAGFVGADTVACLLDTELFSAKGPEMLIDIGTNGEIALFAAGVCTACSTAAGPAFEGAKIEMGLRAEPGAVDTVSYENGRLAFTTVRNAAPKGICGSGLLDAAAALLDAGLLTPSGRLLSRAEAAEHPLSDRLMQHGGKAAFLLTVKEDGGEVILTQQDLRELQLAKGAIRAGIELLIKNAGMVAGDIGKVIMAGAFGCYLNASSAVKIGLLPAAFSGRIGHAGNAAGGGAKKLVSERGAFERAALLAKSARHLELEKQTDFLDTFMDAMAFQMQ